MPAAAEFTPPALTQPLLRGVLRGGLRLLFRSLVRPPTPIALQRGLLRLLTISAAARGITCTRSTIGGRPCEWQRPPGEPTSVFLYLHGGAYLIGSPATHRAITGALAKLGNLAVCTLDYRLAPEHRYPAALEDSVAAYKALLAAGYRAEQIVIGGDSAGGNLALITALRLQESGLPAPRALVCFSPVTDFSLRQLHKPPAGDPLLNPAWLAQAVKLYCPADMPPQDPRLSPVYADLSALPPTLIQVGSDELLLNDSLRFAERAKAAGVELQLEVYPGLWHVFQAHVGLLHAADFAMARVISFLRTQGVCDE
jgi:monoterpene epsilon-lactone hydrolase